MKKFLLIMASICLAVVTFICGCATDGRDGRDGKDGKDVTIEEVYQKYVEEYGEISYEDFLLKIFNYTNEELDELTGLQSKINKSLMSGVTILSRFGYSSKQNGTHLLPGSSYTYYNVYTGSGAILSLDVDDERQTCDAYVVTNCHVIYDDTAENKFCNDVRLYLYGQDESGVNFTVLKNEVYGNESYEIKNDENYRIPAQVVGASVTYDIALLKVEASEVLYRSRNNITVAEFSDERDVTVGQTVYTIGNASGEGMSASSGIVSKDSEYITLTLSEKDYLTDDDYISYRVMRITAPINHGNSGGALYNSDGKIVGIVNAKDEDEGVDNMGYALPGDSTKRLLQLMYDEYKDNGYKMKSEAGVYKAYVNISTTVSDSYAQFNEEKGVAEIIHQVRVNDISGSPAKGNLYADDYLKSAELVDSYGTVKVAKFDITRDYYLRELMLSVRKGDKLIITVERGGSEGTVELEFDNEAYFKHVA